MFFCNHQITVVESQLVDVEGHRGLFHDIDGVHLGQGLRPLVVDVVNDDDDVCGHGKTVIVLLVRYYGELEHLSLEIIPVDWRHVENCTVVSTLNSSDIEKRVCGNG